MKYKRKYYADTGLIKIDPSKKRAISLGEIIKLQNEAERLYIENQQLISQLLKLSNRLN